MKRIKSNYHALQLLKAATPKLRKAIISNRNSDLIKSIAKYILNVLYRNITQTKCGKRKLKKHKTVLSTIADKRVPLPHKKIIIQRGGFLLPLFRAVLPALVTLFFKPSET
jgi:predicted nucleotidyltransferase